MASKIHRRGLADKPFHGQGARVLLVNKNPEDLAYYGAMLQKMQCQVRTSPSFAKGAQYLERERYDLIVLDQGSSRFEGRQVLTTAMEVDTEVPVLVLARSYNRGCYEQAMQSGALDYVEGRLGDAELVAFLETFVPRRTGSFRSSANRCDGPIPGKNNGNRSPSSQLHLAKCPPVLSREHLQL
jgi:DNA-binding response OmpR family regulator